MTSLLRKAKSAASHASAGANIDGGVPPITTPSQGGSSTGFLHHLSSIKSRRKSRIDLSTAVESEQSIAAREHRQQQLRKQHSITQLRRRLVHKASTFNLHSRHRIQVSPETSGQVLQRSEHLFPDSTSTNYNEQSVQTEAFTSQPNSERPSTPSTVYSEAAETILHRAPSRTNRVSSESHITAINQARRHTAPNPLKLESEHLHSPWSRQPGIHGNEGQLTLLQAQAELAALYPDYKEKHIDRFGVWVKMATATAQPPLPFDKLKEITVEACNLALGNVKSYEHTKTEQWNTTIINEILSRLVGESGASNATNGSSSAQPGQSQWKFVVNSTIIQHRGGDETKAARRGMHAAAGAYWNNEKDGMWSFKYDGAERMGLDVVVGIVWVWV